MKGEELRAAEAHIARLEEELLRLKDVKHDLQVLREEHRRLRRSAEGRVAKILSAPFRLFRRRQRTDATEQDEYGRWFARHRVSEEEAVKLREQSRTFSYRPLVSILTPTFNPNDEFLIAAVESVIAQVFENWELILIDDGSSDSRARSLLKNVGQRDARIQIGVQEHGGISSALNTGLARARGDWIALLDHDDLLEPDALFRAIELMQNDREADVIYSDEDKIVDGKLAAPLLKPDWSPEFFRTHDYLGHFVVMRRDLARAEFRSEFDGAQDYDLLLRISEKTDRIRHIPRVLYHWRRTAESTAHNIRRKPGALEAGRRAIRIRAKTNFPNFEIVANLKEATGEYVLFLDPDLEPLDENWLSAMGEQLSNPRIGAVGARIVSSDDAIESAGLIFSPNGSARSAFAGYPRNFRGANRQLQAVRNYSAVSASCLLTRREVLEKTASGNAMGSLDFARDDRVCVGTEFCLNLREHGLRTLSIPYAELRRTSARENASRMCLDLQKRWPEMFRRDPYYNPNLSSERADFSPG